MADPASFPESHRFLSPPAVSKTPAVPPSLPTLDAVCLFHHRQPGGRVAGSHGGFNLHSLASDDVEHIFILLLNSCSLSVSKLGFFVLPVPRNS